VYSNKCTVRIEWGDCDPAGIVFNPRYFEFFDAATAALFKRALGLTKREMMEAYKSSGFPVVKTGAEFRKPAYFGDEVTLESTIKFGRSSFKVDHKVTLKDEMIAEGSETRVWVVRDNYGKMKSSPIPTDVLQKFSFAKMKHEVT
jgi:4-hydroxybenzoyl-CoA thioesterase